METSIVTLFDQLGLDSTEAGIDKFIEKNGPLSGSVESVSYTHLTLPTIYSV